MTLRFAPLALLLALAFTSTAAAQTEETFRPGAAYDNVGYSVAIDGDRMLVGTPGDDTASPEAGAARVYDYVNGAWVQSALLTPPAFTGQQGAGWSVALDGDRAVLGAPYHNGYMGRVFVFDLVGQTWTLVAEMIGTDPAQGKGIGWSVAVDGDRVVAGAPGDDTGTTDAGAVYVFDRVNGVWGQTAKLNAAAPANLGTLGYSVDISGSRIIAGAPVGLTVAGIGSAHIFEQTATAWTEFVLTANDATSGDRFGESVAIDGPLAAVGAPWNSVSAFKDGRAYVFEQVGNPWVETASVDGTAPHDYRAFGYSVDLDGSRLVVGGPSTSSQTQPGAAFVYDLGSAWTLTSRLEASDQASGAIYGLSVAASGDRVIVGSPSEATNGVNAGTAYLYDYSVSTPFLLASGGITIGKASALVGDVHANAALTLNRQNTSYSGSYESNLTASGAITIDRRNTIGGNVTAGGALSVHPTATVVGTATGNAAVAPIALPGLPTFTAGTQNRTVQSNQSLTLAPGAYRNVRVRDGATLTLTAGTYDLDKLLLNRFSSVVFDVSAGPITVNTATRLVVAADVTAEVSGVSGPDPLLSDQVMLNSAQTLDFSIGARSSLVGTVLAPNATAFVRSGSAFRGSLAAAEIILANGASAISHGSPIMALVAAKFTPEADDFTPPEASGEMRLSAAPNPVTSAATITFSLAEAADVSLTVHDLLGRKVASLASGAYAEGEHRARFDASSLQSGVYIVRLTTPEAVAVQRVTVVR